MGQINARIPAHCNCSGMWFQPVMSARWIEHNAVNMVPLGNTELYAQSVLQVLFNLLIRSETAVASVSYKAWLFFPEWQNLFRQMWCQHSAANRNFRRGLFLGIVFFLGKMRIALNYSNIYFSGKSSLNWGSCVLQHAAGWPTSMLKNKQIDQFNILVLMMSQNWSNSLDQKPATSLSWIFQLGSNVVDIFSSHWY